MKLELISVKFEKKEKKKRGILSKKNGLISLLIMRKT